MKSISTNFLRSNTIESTHYAKVLIKDIKGKSIYTSGNDEDHIYPRSSIKIFATRWLAQFSASQETPFLRIAPAARKMWIDTHQGSTAVEEVAGVIHSLLIEAGTVTEFLVRQDTI